MKKILMLSLIVMFMLGVSSCNKNELRSFKNFDYNTVYFPYQYPVRTLILGDYNLADNTDDNNLKFAISARIGGMYENKSDWTVDYAVDESLVNNLFTDPNKWDGKLSPSSDSLVVLPSKYYTLSPIKNLVIPNGKFYGEIEVQLTQDFLDDPKAWTTRYVIPLKITSTTADSILSGKANATDPDPRIAADWAIVPKDFTIFGIKFVNAYHGNYLHKGKSVITDVNGNVTQTIVYSQAFIEQDEIWALQTTGKNKVTVSGMLRDTHTSPGNFTMNLTFSKNGDCIVSTADRSQFPVTGNGKFVENGESWGNQSRNAIYLNYKVIDGTNTSTITDTLVFRDKGVAFQQYVPIVKP